VSNILFRIFSLILSYSQVLYSFTVSSFASASVRWLGDPGESIIMNRLSVADGLESLVVDCCRGTFFEDVLFYYLMLIFLVRFAFVVSLSNGLLSEWLRGCSKSFNMVAWWAFVDGFDYGDDSFSVGFWELALLSYVHSILLHLVETSKLPFSLFMDKHHLCFSVNGVRVWVVYGQISVFVFGKTKSWQHTWAFTIK